MDILKAVQGYMSKMMNQSSGVKVLLLDSETTPIISQASTTSNLLSHEIYLTDRIDNFSGRERMPHLSCLAFLRPSKESIAALERELKDPKYGSYYLFFSNILSKSSIERLAEADENEVVKEVQEYFADYCPITASHFSLNILPTPLNFESVSTHYRLYEGQPNKWDTNSQTGSLGRHVEGLTALLLSLKKKPFIRYDRNSQMARKLGQELSYQMTTESQLFNFRPTNVPPLLLILDRRSDPVTPLLSQWTYQAMVHDLIGISNGRVSLANAPDVSKDHKEVVLSPEQDSFFERTMYDNFGDLGAHIKEYVAEYQIKGGKTKKIETVADMKRFVEEYPEFRRLGGNVSKHVALVTELSRLVDKEKLLEVSEVEQNLASNESSHGADLRSVMDLLVRNDISREAKIRLGMLYGLRYQTNQNNDIKGVIRTLTQAEGCDESDGNIIKVMLNYAMVEQEANELFPRGGIFSRGKSALKGLKGVDNVYTQHIPKLAEIVDDALNARLKETTHPFLEGQEGLQDYLRQAQTRTPTPSANQQAPIKRDGYKPQEIIVFIIGGSTYEEARTIAKINEQTQNTNVSLPKRVILGGTGILNSQDFISLVRDAATRFPPTMSSGPLTMRPGRSLTASSSDSAPMANYQAPTQNLQIGNLSIPIGQGGPSRTGNTIEAGVDNFVDAAKNLFGKVRRGVEDL